MHPPGNVPPPQPQASSEPSLRTIVIELSRARDSADPYGFTFEPQRYLVRSAGGRVRELTIDWDPPLLELLRRVHRPSVDVAASRSLGAELRSALGEAGWELLEAEIVEAVHGEAPLHITFRANAAELYALPWELVPLDGVGLPLGALPTVLLRYEWPGSTTRRRRGPALTGRVLFAWSAAGGAVPAAEHGAAIAAAGGGARLDPQLDTLAHASLQGLAQALAQADRSGRTIDALHLLCHGRGDPSGGFGLALDGPDGGPERVGAEALARVLIPHADMIRLVVIAACNSGDELPAHRLGGIAQTLHRAGIQAVIASRSPLSASGSVLLTERLYAGLFGAGQTLEAAFLGAKDALGATTGGDWAALQLYARAADGDATDILGLAAPSPPAAAGGRRRLALIVASLLLLTLGIAAVLAMRSTPDGDGTQDPGERDASRPTTSSDLAAQTSTTAATSTGAAEGTGTQRPAEASTGEASTTAGSTTAGSAIGARAIDERAVDEPRATKRRRKAVPFTLSLGGSRADAGCWEGCGDDRACKDACGERHRSVRRLISEHLPTLGACFDPRKPDTFLDPYAHEGTRWTAELFIRVHTSGELEVLRVKTRSRAPIPAECIQRVVAELRLPPAEGDYDSSVISILNSDDEVVRRVYGGWKP